MKPGPLHEVVEMIRANADFPDLRVTWHVPEVVALERQYQMLKRAQEMLPTVERLERLLGHNLNITGAILERRVAEAIDTQVKAHALVLHSLDAAKVNWQGMIRAAAFRQAPFEAGEKEKGFRDAIVAETFLQLVLASPVTPKVCRVAMVTGDSLLADAVKERTKDAKNVRVLASLEELSGLINTLVADVGEEFVAQLIPRAQRYFFTPKDQSTLYYSQNLGSEISTKFKSELEALPEGATRRQNGPWRIAPPHFVRKERQRIFWVTRMLIEATAFSRSTPISSFALPPGTGIQLSKTSPSVKISTVPIGSPQIGSGAEHSWFLGGQQVLFGEEKEVARGTAFVEVTWSTLVRASRAFTSPRIEEIKFVGTTWE